jgi:hypothetical protein
MNRERLRGVVGLGFIATHHTDAVRRLGDVDMWGLRGRTASPQLPRQPICSRGANPRCMRELGEVIAADTQHAVASAALAALCVGHAQQLGSNRHWGHVPQKDSRQ